MGMIAASFFLLACALQSGSASAAPACEESGYCSLGHVQPVTGDVKSGRFPYSPFSPCSCTPGNDQPARSYLWPWALRAAISLDSALCFSNRAHMRTPLLPPRCHLVSFPPDSGGPQAGPAGAQLQERDHPAHLHAVRSGPRAPGLLSVQEAGPGQHHHADPQ